MHAHGSVTALHSRQTGRDTVFAQPRGCCRFGAATAQSVEPSDAPSRCSRSRMYKRPAPNMAAPSPSPPGGDPDNFKEINEAYDVLKDPKKREIYDRVGPGI
jgi:hypothetical protein